MSRRLHLVVGTLCLAAVASAQRITCPEPNIPNAELASRQNRYVPGARRLITCNPGYELNPVVERNEIICRRATRNWSYEIDPDQYCLLKVTCDVPFVDNGDFSTYDIAQVGDVRQLTCNMGYNLIGLSQITCMEDGSWSGSPYCEEFEKDTTEAPTIKPVPAPTPAPTGPVAPPEPRAPPAPEEPLIVRVSFETTQVAVAETTTDWTVEIIALGAAIAVILILLIIFMLLVLIPGCACC